MYHYLCTSAKHPLGSFTMIDIEPYVKTFDGGRKSYEIVGTIVQSNIGKIISFYETLPDNLKEDFKRDLSEIGRIKEWLYEQYIPEKFGKMHYTANNDDLKLIHNVIHDKLEVFVKKYNLIYGVD